MKPTKSQYTHIYNFKTKHYIHDEHKQAVQHTIVKHRRKYVALKIKKKSDGADNIDKCENTRIK